MKMALQLSLKAAKSCVTATVLALVCLWLFPSPSRAESTAGSPIFTLAIANEPMPPYFTIGGDSSSIGGIWRQILDSVFVETLGWRVNYLLRPWQRAQNEVRQGTADGMITIVTPQRLEYARQVPTPFCCFPLHLFTWKDHPRLAEMQSISDVEELAAMDLQMVANIGNGWYESNIEKRGVKTTWLPSDEQVYRFVALGRGDGLIDLPGSMKKLQEKYGLVGQLVDSGVSFGSVAVNLLIGNDSPFVSRIAEIDLALQTVGARGAADAHCPEAAGAADAAPGCVCRCGQER